VKRVSGRKPSPATVISIVALVFAVAGTAVAGVATISVLNKKEKKQTRNIAKQEIKKAAAGLSVANATNAINATNAVNATNATNAASATTAENAGQADNSTKVNSVAVESVIYRQNATTDNPQTIVDLGGLTLAANCNGGGLTLNARTSVSNATLSSAAIDTATGQASPSHSVHLDDFDTTLTQGLVGAPPNDLVLNVQYTRPGTGLLAPAAATSAVLMVDNDGAPTCVVTGHAFQSGGSLAP
jgi:hypothetical protein